MNVFEYDPIEVGQMSYDEFGEWKAQWIADFQRISAMIRIMKAQTAQAARYYDTVENSSYIAAGRCISQRNLQDCKNYAHSLMELLDEVKIQRAARRIVARWERERLEAEERREREQEDQVQRFFQNQVETSAPGDDILARQIFNTLATNRAVAQSLKKMMDLAINRMEHERVS